MQLFLNVYPTVVLILGAIAAAGSLICGAWCAIVYATFNYDPNTNRNAADSLSQRAFFAAVFNAIGCFGAIIALAFVKWIVG